MLKKKCVIDLSKIQWHSDPIIFLTNKVVKKQVFVSEIYII